MLRQRFRTAIGIALVGLLLVANASAQSRVALVIGNAAYPSAPIIKTATTDAAIVAETLRGAGFDVIELNDVRQGDIGQAMRDFLDKAAATGPTGVAFFYYAGYAAQADSKNYLVPIDAAITRASDVANEAFRLNDLLDELTKLPLAARVVILDAARDHKFGQASNQPVPKGLAKIDAKPGMLIAFSAEPGAVIAAHEDEAYSPYTQALVTLMHQPGLDMVQILESTQQQAGKATGSLPTELVLFAPAQVEAPAPAAPQPVATPPAETAGAPADFAKLPCQKFLTIGSTEMTIIPAWLDGYYKGPSDPPVFNPPTFTTNVKRLAEYCVAHPKVGLIDASDRIFGSRRGQRTN